MVVDSSTHISEGLPIITLPRRRNCWSTCQLRLPVLRDPVSPTKQLGALKNGENEFLSIESLLIKNDMLLVELITSISGHVIM